MNMNILILNRFIIFIAIISCLHVPANDINPINKKQEISQLLKELRELRKAKYTLINEWKDEKAQLELIMNLDNKKIETLNQSITDSNGSIEELNQELKILTEENTTLNNELTKISQWINDECQNIIDSLSKDYPFLITDEHLTIVKNIMTDEQEITSRVGQFLNLIQTLSIDAVKAHIDFKEIDINGKSYGTNIIRLGGVLEYFVTPDARLGGVRTNTQDNEKWTLLSTEMNRQILEIVRIINKETNTKLVTIPVPSKNIIEFK